MHTNNVIANIQQKHVKEYAEQSDSYHFFNLLTSPELLSTVENLLPDHRERRFPPTETLSLFLAQAMASDRSCQNIVNRLSVQRVSDGLTPYSTGTGSYCKARQRLPLALVAELVRCTGELIDKEVPIHWRWQSRPVRLIDGTTVTLPDTQANQLAYPQPAGQQPGLGFPICRIVGIMCLASGGILNASMGPISGKGTSEQTLLRGMLDTFSAGDIVLGDGFYCTYFLLAELISRGIDGLFEQLGARRKSTDFRKGHRLGPSDHRVVYKKPKKPDWMTQAQYLAAPDTLTVREIEVGGKILVTTLLSPNDAPKHELKQLYKSRWHVELDLRNIKTTLGMETLSCKTPEMSEKEMWVYLLAYNLIRIVMAQAASLADLLPRQLSFKHTLQIWRAYRQYSSPIDDDDGLWIVLVMVTEKTVGNRPGRVEPRAVKRRPKPYPLLTKPRAQARAHVLKYGHPKKQK